MKKGKKKQDAEKTTNNVNGDNSPILYRRAMQCKDTNIPTYSIYLRSNNKVNNQYYFSL
jgi:hypothetical protein